MPMLRTIFRGAGYFKQKNPKIRTRPIIAKRMEKMTQAVGKEDTYEVMSVTSKPTHK